MKMKGLTKEQLSEMYWGKQLNQRQIAELFDVNADTVYKRMEKLQIPVRSPHDALVLSYKDPERKIDTWSKGRKASDETRGKLSLSHKGQIPWRTGKPWSEEGKLKLSLAHKGQECYWKGKKRSAEAKANLRRAAREYWTNISAEQREEIRRRTTGLWQDPKYVIKQIQSRGARPNKPEKSLSDIASKEFPQFRYNGDGSLGIVLAGLVPDFVNVNGRKQLIEIFGLYWHQIRKPKWHQTELGRIMAYNSIGWDCLIIWEDELRDTDAVISKIKKFSRRKLASVGV